MALRAGGAEQGHGDFENVGCHGQTTGPSMAAKVRYSNHHASLFRAYRRETDAYVCHFFEVSPDWVSLRVPSSFPGHPRVTPLSYQVPPLGGPGTTGAGVRSPLPRPPGGLLGGAEAIDR